MDGRGEGGEGTGSPEKQRGTQAAGHIHSFI